MASKHDIRSAGESLRRHLAHHRWLTAVGVGRDQEQECLFVYASRLSHSEKSAIPECWEGFRVIPRRMSVPRHAYH